MPQRHDLQVEGDRALRDQRSQPGVEAPGVTPHPATWRPAVGTGVSGELTTFWRIYAGHGVH